MYETLECPTIFYNHSVFVKLITLARSHFFVLNFDYIYPLMTYHKLLTSNFTKIHSYSQWQMNSRLVEIQAFALRFIRLFFLHLVEG